jgi:hypothetical protein
MGGGKGGGPGPNISLVLTNGLLWPGISTLCQGQVVRCVIVAVALEAAALGLEATLGYTGRE